MKKPLPKSKSTWLSYLDTVKDQTCTQEQVQLTGFDDFLSANSFANTFLKHSIPFIYLLDYKKGLYNNMSENFAGYKSECFLKDGINHTLEIYQPDHLRIFSKEVFPDRLQILKEIKPEEHKNYVFSYNLCVKNRNGQSEHFLQRSCFISNDAGNPILSMGILINTNHYNTNQIIQTVDKIDANGLAAHETVGKKVYYLNEEDKLFSKREKEVLFYMADGLSSKQIADKLFVSEHTIINHRRNMQDKSSMPNATALVAFAVRNGII